MHVDASSKHPIPYKPGDTQAVGRDATKDRIFGTRAYGAPPGAFALPRGGVARGDVSRMAMEAPMEGGNVRITITMSHRPALSWGGGSHCLVALAGLVLLVAGADADADGGEASMEGRRFSSHEWN